MSGSEATVSPAQIGIDGVAHGVLRQPIVAGNDQSEIVDCSRSELTTLLVQDLLRLHGVDFVEEPQLGPAVAVEDVGAVGADESAFESGPSFFFPTKIIIAS